MNVKQSILIAAAGGVLVLAATPVFAHGDVTPQVVDTKKLKQLGKDWRAENPYRGDKEAIKVGDSAYNQNCARCHGLGGVSGGIAPDLRKLPVDKETDDYYVTSVRRGKVRNGNVYMPPFEGILSQEAMWAIRAYIDSKHID